MQRYPIRLPAAEGGGWEERYWSPINSPVFGPAATDRFIVHRVEDVTPFVRAEQAEPHSREGSMQLLQGRSSHLEAEIVRRTQELLRTNEQLRHSEERFKLAVAIAKMGTFEIDLRTDAVVVNEAGSGDVRLGAGRSRSPSQKCRRSSIPMIARRSCSRSARRWIRPRRR